MLGIRAATVRLSIDTKLPEYSDVLFENFILFFLFLARESDNNVAKQCGVVASTLRQYPKWLNYIALSNNYIW